MDTNKSNNISFIVIIVLLISQVFLVSILVIKFNELKEIVVARGSESQPIAPSYIADISLDDDPQLGSPDAVITIVEFGDFECPYCAEAEKNIKTIMKEFDGKILFVYRDFPLVDIHPNAFQSAEAANCAGDQGAYWEMHDLLYSNQSYLENESLNKYAVELNLNVEQFGDCLRSNKFEEEIKKDIQDGLTYQVTGTPTFFINGNRIVGGTIEQLRGAINLLLLSEAE